MGKYYDPNLRTKLNRAGSKILLEEIDLLFEKHPAVAEACTFGLSDTINGKVVASAIHLTVTSIGALDLRYWCRERMHAECIPDDALIGSLENWDSAFNPGTG